MARITRIGIVSGLAGFGATWFVLALSIAGVAGLDSIPPDVLARSDIARANMRQIATALLMYANENNDHYPPDLRMLYPDYISDPKVFWHPGDSDPQPTTIDNNEPNQPNSTRISFEYASDPESLCELDPMIWDNTAANNAGFFINRVSRYGAVMTTDPPYVTPTPTRVQVAQHNLRTLSMALQIYAADNNDFFPDDPIRLAEGGYVCSPGIFWNPGDSDPEPTQITNSVPNAPNSTQISFDFLTTGHRWDDFAPDDILVQDNSPANNGGMGVNVVRANGRVEFIYLCHDPFADADGDGDVDQGDFGVFQRCLGSAGSPLPEDCKCFDRPEPPAYPDGDDDVDQDDFLKFEACASGPNIPADPGCDDN